MDAAPAGQSEEGRGAGLVTYCVTRRNIPASLCGGDPGARIAVLSSSLSRLKLAGQRVALQK